MADKVVAAVAAALEAEEQLLNPATAEDAEAQSGAAPETTSTALPSRYLTIAILLHPPVFLDGRRPLVQLFVDNKITESCIVEFPHEIVLRLPVDAVISITLAVPELIPPWKEELATGPSRSPPVKVATAYIPLRKVVDSNMSLSFCTLWMGLEDWAPRAKQWHPDRVEVDRRFTRALEIGRRTFEVPKLGITLKVADDEASEADQLSMFSVVDMYARELASVFIRAEDTLKSFQDEAQGARREVEYRALGCAAEVESVRDDLHAQRKRCENLSSEVHTLRLARRDLQRKLAKQQEEATFTWRSVGLYAHPQCECGTSSSSTCPGTGSAADSSGADSARRLIKTVSDATKPKASAAAALQRAERVAERERQRARDMTKEIEVLKGQLEEALADRELFEAKAAMAEASAREAAVEDVHSTKGLPQSAGAQAEEILRLRREIGALSRAKAQARRQITLLEQQLLEAQQQSHELERRSEMESQTSPTAGCFEEVKYETNGSSNSTSTCDLSKVNHQLRSQNIDLHEELLRCRGELQRARADLQPLKEENYRLQAEIETVLKDKLEASEQAAAAAADHRNFVRRGGTPTWGGGPGNCQRQNLQNNPPSLSPSSQHPPLIQPLQLQRRAQSQQGFRSRPHSARSTKSTAGGRNQDQEKPLPKNFVERLAACRLGISRSREAAVGGV
eukprot:TRINITY_DN35401_c0_g1_i1.p1 TRINITY_DN35401_c0_g1~~TRINITY_DN35401_c0_g1_i1.p1  ORF type:complete len:681 (-),score=157.97 TRINITY_DN35401_c0_g1_i1:129-2171(-)